MSWWKRLKKNIKKSPLEELSPERERRLERERLSFLILGLLFCFSLLVIQFYRVQVLQGERWLSKAHRQHKWVEDEPFRRGIFYGQYVGRPMQLSPPALVVDVPMSHLHVDPKRLPHKLHKKIIHKLRAVLGKDKLSKEELRKNLGKQSRNRRLFMWVEKKQEEELRAWWKVFSKEHALPSNALFFVSDYKRSYPYGALLGHLLHTIRDRKEEKSGQGIPTGGLEAKYHSFLKGKKGKRLFLRSPRHSLEVGEIIEHPLNGADVYLTIDPFLQTIAEEEISKGVHAANAKSGWAILMHPESGEVYAWAQYPSFDPENYQDFFNDASLMEYTKTLGLLNAQQPGSVMKPITLAIALAANQELMTLGEAPLFDPSEKVPTFSAVFKGRTKAFYDTGKYRFLNMNMALQRSSNIYMAKLIDLVLERRGIDWYRDQLVYTFGFGQKSALAIPGESAGRVPKPGRRHANGALEWSTPTHYSLAIGHNILTTSIQMLRSYAVLANGGYFVEPKLVKKISRKLPLGEQILDRSIRGEGVRVLDKEVCKRVIEAMQYTTKFGGTAYRANIAGFSEAGKTGTAEKVVNGRYSQDLYFSTFIGFAPVEKPEFVLLVSINEPEKKYTAGVGKNHNAGVCCAPVFREIGRRSLQYLGVRPDDPYGYPSGDPRRDTSKAKWVKESSELRELYKEWNR